MYSQTVAALQPNGHVLPTDNRILNELCGLGYMRLANGEAVSGSDLKANYIRPSDAEMSK
jgi:hypothetical protein